LTLITVAEPGPSGACLEAGAPIDTLGEYALAEAGAILRQARDRAPLTCTLRPCGPTSRSETR